MLRRSDAECCARDAPAAFRAALLALARRAPSIAARAFGARSVGSRRGRASTPSMTGYQEILTDPSVRRADRRDDLPADRERRREPEDDESARPFLSGFVVKELFDAPSNWRARESLDAYPARAAACPGIAGHRHARAGAGIAAQASRTACSRPIPRSRTTESCVARARRRCRRSTGATSSPASPARRRIALDARALGADRRPDPARARVRRRSRKVVAYDYGVKRNILRLLVEQGFDVTVVPAQTTAAAARSRYQPDAVFLSNGPGDPAAVRGRARADVRGSPTEAADLRDLPRPPDPRPRARRHDREAQVRPPRRQPARPGPRDQARSRSAPRTTATRSTPTRCAPPASRSRSRT